MLGNPQNNDKEFNVENYEEFYEHHLFQPIPEPDCFNIHELIPRFGWAFDKVEELKPRNLLDLGSLDGSFALTIARHFEIPVTGVDLTKDGVDLATKRAQDNGLTATFKQGLIEDHLRQFIKEGKVFDVVTLFEIMEHVEDPKLVLDLVDQVVPVNGSVLISTPDFEAPTYGKDDEVNKCHIRLYTTADHDYEAVNKYGTLRKATSMKKQLGVNRKIKEMGVYSELINVHYQ